MAKGRKGSQLTGKRFGSLTVLERVKGPDTKATYWLTRCDCGREKIRRANGLVKTTGCPSCAISRAKPNKSGSDLKEYSCWRQMLRRCHLVTDRTYKYYGGRGIEVCPEWRKDFWRFYADMGPAPEKHSIERIRNNEGYSPENCQWATRTTQARNRRSCIRITIDGVTKVAEEWLQEKGLSRATFDARRKRGWTLEEAISRPLVFNFKELAKAKELNSAVDADIS